MHPLPANLEEVIHELKQEVAPRSSRDRVLANLTKPKRPVILRPVAVTIFIALCVLPIALRTGGRAEAVTLDIAIAQSGRAPYLIIRQYRLLGARDVLTSESLFGPNARTERTIFSPYSLTETHYTPGQVFHRYLFKNDEGFKPYETIERSSEEVSGSDTFDATAAIRKLIEEKKRSGALTEAASDSDHIVTLKGGGLSIVIERSTQRILRMEWESAEGKFVSEYDYPVRVPTGRLGIPPLGWAWPGDSELLAFQQKEPLPRFDLDAERNEFARLSAKGLRTSDLRGVRVKLVGVFQSVTDPGQPLYVVYESGTPKPANSHLATVHGLGTRGSITTMKRPAPKIYATVLSTGSRRWLKASVEVPAFDSTGKYVGDCRFNDVPVKAYSNQLRNRLRVPSFQ